jgi:hypothetical protein
MLTEEGTRRPGSTEVVERAAILRFVAGYAMTTMPREMFEKAMLR